MANWAIRQVDALIEATLANDSIIKTKMGIASGKARVAGYRATRDPGYFPYIFFYPIPSPAARVNGNVIVQHNTDYDIEVRTIGAPTDNTEAIVDRIQVLIGTMVRQLTPDGLWVVSAVFKKEIAMLEQGEAQEIFYTRRGGTYSLQVVSA